MSNNNVEIGWYWRLVGVLLLLAAIGLPAIRLLRGGDLSLQDIVLAGLLVFASMVVIRPDWMDRNFKSIIDALPFTKYQKPEGQ